VEKLPAINVEDSNYTMAKKLLEIASSPQFDENQKLELISDSLAALRRDNYAKGLSGASLDPRNGVRLPNIQ
jgi:hypothetical protein